MNKSGVVIKSVGELDLTSLDVYKYGGCSKVYLDSAQNEIYKIYRSYQTERKRQYIYSNIFELFNNSNKIDGNEIVLPNTLYMNEQNLLEVQKMEHIDGVCGVNSLREYYNSKKYYLIILKLIKLIKKYTFREFVIEDLKLSNIVFDRSLNPKIIDSDFVSPKTISDIFSKTTFVKEYLDRFNDELQADYNLFNLYFMISMLILEEDEFRFAININKWPSIENLKAMNYFIQKNRAIPQNFKMELRNLFTGNKEISFSEDVEYDISEFVLKRKQ